MENSLSQLSTEGRSHIKELKEYTIPKYNGRFRTNSIAIGLIKPELGIIEDLADDFKIINNLSQSKFIIYSSS